MFYFLLICGSSLYSGYSLSLIAPSQSTNLLGKRIHDNLLHLQTLTKEDLGRVITCWSNFNEGKVLRRYLDTEQEVLQEAHCYIDGLDAIPFHDSSLSEFKWVKELAAEHASILAELKTYENPNFSSNMNMHMDMDERQWQSARDSKGSSYGPKWTTLGLQDRSKWDLDRLLHFPKTKHVIDRLHVPACELFFARQESKSGILPHTDKNNFILTCHVGLEVPKGGKECWLKVGKEKYYWENGHYCIFDTSIEHSTYNAGATDRIVLLVRFWHPGLKSHEISALKFIFDMLDHHYLYGEDSLRTLEMNYLGAGGGWKKKTKSSSMPSSNAGLGFGKVNAAKK